MRIMTFRFIRLSAMLATGLISYANFRFAVAYPAVTVTGRDGKTHVCNSASRVTAVPAQA